MTMMRIEGDRRQEARIRMERPCKVFEPRGQRYLLGTTRDVTTRSLLICSDASHPLGVSPEADVLGESGGNLVRHPGAAAAQTSQFHLC